MAVENVGEILYKGQRILRTALQGATAALPVFIAVLLVTQGSLNVEWLAPVLAVSVALQTWLAKLMAIPTVNEWLSRNTSFGSVPKAVATLSPTPPVVVDEVLFIPEEEPTDR